MGEGEANETAKVKEEGRAPRRGSLNEGGRKRVGNRETRRLLPFYLMWKESLTLKSTNQRTQSRDCTTWANYGCHGMKFEQLMEHKMNGNLNLI